MYVQQKDGSQAQLVQTRSQNNTPTPQNGVVNVSGGKTYDIFTIPPVFTFTSVSASGSGAATVTQYIFNGSTLNAAVTNNGSGAGSIVNTYGDGFVGRVYDSQVASWNGGRGVRIQGFTVTVTTNSTGAQTSTPFNTLQLNLLNANGQGSSTPVPIDVTAAQRNTQFQIGQLTVISQFYLNTLNQISYSMPVNTAFAWTFTTENGSL